jgi:2,4-dienoyl-CoA reductase-like NADH-dependent reductase (Old Yellow Enzyme family)
VFDLPALGWPAAATEADMARLLSDFAAAAAFAVGPRGGADAVELHLGHGYLLSQWLSPAFNVRADGHGGSACARARFPLAVARAVRAAIGPTKALLVKTGSRLAKKPKSSVLMASACMRSMLVMNITNSTRKLLRSSLKKKALIPLL